MGINSNDISKREEKRHHENSYPYPIKPHKKEQSTKMRPRQRKQTEQKKEEKQPHPTN